MLTDEDVAFVNTLNAGSLFEQANCFYDSCLNMSKELDPIREHNKLHVINVNSLFAIELYLKTLLFYRNIIPPMKHSLKAIWDQIPEQIKSDIKQEWSSKIDERHQKIITSFTNEYTIIRYNEGCLALDFNILLNCMEGLQKVCSNLGVKPVE